MPEMENCSIQHETGYSIRLHYFQCYWT